MFGLCCSSVLALAVRDVTPPRHMHLVVRAQLPRRTCLNRRGTLLRRMRLVARLSRGGAPPLRRICLVVLGSQLCETGCRGVCALWLRLG